MPAVTTPPTAPKAMPIFCSMTAGSTDCVGEAMGFTPSRALPRLPGTYLGRRVCPMRFRIARALNVTAGALGEACEGGRRHSAKRCATPAWRPARSEQRSDLGGDVGRPWVLRGRLQRIQ